MVRLVFCDLSHAFHKQVPNVSQHVFVILLWGILTSPLLTGVSYAHVCIGCFLEWDLLKGVASNKDLLKGIASNKDLLKGIASNKDLLKGIASNKDLLKGIASNKDLLKGIASNKDGSPYTYFLNNDIPFVTHFVRKHRPTMASPQFYMCSSLSPSGKIYTSLRLYYHTGIQDLWWLAESVFVSIGYVEKIPLCLRTKRRLTVYASGNLLKEEYAASLS